MKTKILLIIALLIALAEGARGQIYVDSYRFGVAAELLLDDYPTAEAAFSLRLLRTGYTGDCIMVRRSSNGDSTNIGFVNNYLDTATLKTFCSSTNCFVRVWYDQSGNARNARQTTDANQPTIVTSGAIFYKGTTPSIDFDGTNDRLEIANSTASFNFMHNGTSSALFATLHTDVSTVNYFLGSNATSGATRGHVFGQDANHSLFIGASNGTGAGGVWSGYISTGSNILSTNLFVISSLWDMDNATAANRIFAYVNGSATSAGTNTHTGAVTTGNATYNLEIGSSGNNTLPMNGGWKELIYYSSDQTSNRTAIRDNINTFYSIY